MTAIDPLPYESRTPGTLQPGEVLLWEGVPLPGKRPPSVRAVFVVSSVVLIVLLTGGTLLGMAGLMPPVLLAMLLGASAVGIVVWAVRPRRQAGVTFRVTDLRLLRLPLGSAATSVPVSNLTGFAVKTQRGHASFQLNGDDDEEMGGEVVVYERTPDPAALERLIAALPGRTDRRATLRRTPKPLRPAPSGTMSTTVHRVQPAVTTEPDDDVALAAGEVILWSGQPRLRDPMDVDFLLGRLKIIAWMLVPIAVLLLHRGTFGFQFGHWATTGIAVVWMLLALHALTLQRWFDADRRKRTRYYLTNVRAIEVYHGRTRTARSVFLDMVSELSLTNAAPDGCGDLLLLGGTFNFQRIENVQALHTLAIEAIREAGTGQLESGANKSEISG